VIEPGARRAAEVSRGRVGVIATEATVRSDAYPRALRRLRPDLAVVSRACPLFVPLVEEGWHEDDEVTTRIAERYLAPLLEAEIDTLVLGCTHYPLLKEVLARVAGPAVTLVDSAEAVAEMVAQGLAEAGLTETGGAAATQHLCVTDGGESFQLVAGRILGDPNLPLEWVEVV
jgi:glutamate racemase